MESGSSSSSGSGRNRSSSSSRTTLKEAARVAVVEIEAAVIEIAVEEIEAAVYNRSNSSRSCRNGGRNGNSSRLIWL